MWTSDQHRDASGEGARPLDARLVYEQHGEFVWKSLARLGVREADLRDMTQEVFVVVHRRLAERDGSSAMTTWLFGICLKVAAAYRRRAHRRREDLVADAPDAASTHDGAAGATPEQLTASAQARARLAMVLDALELEQRAVFVMFELDEMPCGEIAQVLGCPVGTVHSRLRAARREFEAALKRLQAREQSRAAAALRAHPTRREGGAR